MATGKTFNESWHRVASMKISVRPTVQVRKQFFRGEKWYILEDPFNNRFFRLRPEAYDFVSRLDPTRTVDEVWQDCLDRRPDDAPGQDDAVQLLSQLYFANLLYFEGTPDSEKLFERYKQRRQREIRSSLLTVMFMRIPLLDPDAFLRRLQPLLKILIGPVGAVIWFAVVGLAMKAAVDSFDDLWDQAQGILAPGNLPLLYLGLILTKTIHEFGHAAVCRRFGGEVHTMGVMLLVFTPLPYVDASSSWAFRSRWRRALVGSAGMITEVFLAALATFVWARTGEGTLNSLAYNMMFIASVSTVIFNINPLLRFDGYYILSDVVDIPNLSTRAFRQLRHVGEKYLFGYRDSEAVAETGKEAGLLGGFGILSGLYRGIVFVGIVLFVADKFFLAGLVMAAICVVSWLMVPIGKFVNYLATSPNLSRSRMRAVGVTVGGVALIVGFLGVYPFPNRFRAPGIVEAVGYELVATDAPGYVAAILQANGATVEPGTPLVELADPDLRFEIRAAEAELEETRVFLQRAVTERSPEVEPLERRMDSVQRRLADLDFRQASLVVRARQSGVWVSPSSVEMLGLWLERGTPLGQIVNPEEFRFAAVVSQDEAASLFEDGIEGSEVRLRGQSETNLPVSAYLSIPFQHDRLPSAALGWRGGGDVAVSLSDQSGLTTTEPFFQIYAYLDPTSDAAYLHGSSGQIRFTLERQPLLQQWFRDARRLLQRRYQI